MALSATERSQAYRAKRKAGEINQKCVTAWVSDRAYTNLMERAQRSNTSITEALNRILEQL